MTKLLDRASSLSRRDHHSNLRSPLRLIAQTKRGQTLIIGREERNFETRPGFYNAKDMLSHVAGNNGVVVSLAFSEPAFSMHTKSFPTIEDSNAMEKIVMLWRR
jgi:hypothetical protein